MWAGSSRGGVVATLLLCGAAVCAVAQPSSLDVAREQMIGDGVGGMVPLGSLDLFGASVCNLGDLDSDGVDDVGVGAIFDDDGGDRSGAFYVLFMNSSGLVGGVQKISQTEGGWTMPRANMSLFGSSCELVGFNVTGSGRPLVAVGAFFEGGGAGAVYLFELEPTGVVAAGTLSRVANGTGGFPPALVEANDQFGGSLSMAYGAGPPRLVAGVRGDDDGGQNRGGLYVMTLDFGQTPVQVSHVAKISSLSGNLTEAGGKIPLH